MDLPIKPLPQIEADPFLLRRAVNNLLTNCVRHNAPGGTIRLGARAEGGNLVLFVEGGTAVGRPAPAEPDRPLAPDGGGRPRHGAEAGAPDRRGPWRVGAIRAGGPPSSPRQSGSPHSLREGGRPFAFKGRPPLPSA